MDNETSNVILAGVVALLAIWFNKSTIPVVVRVRQYLPVVISWVTSLFSRAGGIKDDIEGKK